MSGARLPDESGAGDDQGRATHQWRVRVERSEALASSIQHYEETRRVPLMALGPGWTEDFRPEDRASIEELSNIEEIDADLLYDSYPDYDDTEDEERHLDEQWESQRES